MDRWETDFPIREEVEDFSGNMRTFVITCNMHGIGFTVRAEEEGKEGMGYGFAAFSETSPYSALGRVRKKMSLALASRHVTGSSGDRRLLHDRLRGRIASDGSGGVILIVDGLPLDIDNLATVLGTHEGWEFELQIVDALE